MKKENKHTITLVFPTEELQQEFLGYMSDGGGEQEYFFQEFNLECNYKQAFPAHGYKPEVHGEPKIIVTEIEED